MTSSFVSVGSARVAYRALGMGPAVLLVNGTGGGDGHWGDLIERLARSHTVVTLDYSGAGETTDDGAPLDLPTLARQVAAVAEAVGAPHVDLVGHSLGAAIATVLAAERPELVRTLTLVAGFRAARDRPARGRRPKPFTTGDCLPAAATVPLSTRNGRRRPQAAGQRMIKAVIAHNQRRKPTRDLRAGPRLSPTCAIWGPISRFCAW